MTLILILIVIGVLFCISRVRSSGRKSNGTDAERRRREAEQEDLDEDTDRYN